MNGKRAKEMRRNPPIGAAYLVEQQPKLRDYFIAHAPTEPQPWFVPAMPPRPAVPAFHRAPDAVRAELRDLDYEELLGPEDMSPEARSWHEERQAGIEANRAWGAERRKQLYAQWPAAWADEMLKQRRA